jgi:hypothetical protein
MRTATLIFFLLNFLLITCADDPVSPCINDDLDTIPDTTNHDEDLFEITAHLNTENCELDYNRITFRLRLSNINYREEFTIYEDSAIVMVDSILAGRWRGQIGFYRDSTFLEQGTFKIDIRPDMFTDYYFDYLTENRDSPEDAIKPDHETIENQIFAAITDSLVNEFRSMEGYENAYHFVHDSTFYRNGMTDLSSDIMFVNPTIKTSTFIDYYIANQTNILVDMVLDEDKYKYINIPNKFYWSTIDSLRSTDPNALGVLIFSRVGFSPSFNQALVFVIEGWRTHEGEGLIYYLERTEKGFRIIAKFGTWIS